MEKLYILRYIFDLQLGKQFLKKIYTITIIYNVRNRSK